MKRILITGGGGFIGSALAIQLIDVGNSVIIIDSFSPQIHGADHKASPLFQRIPAETEIIHADIREQHSLRSALRNADMVVHLAAETGTGQSMYDIHNYVSVNIDATGLMLDMIANDDQINIEKIVVASSRAIYGEGKYHCQEHGVVYPNSRRVVDMQAKDFAVKCPICSVDAQVQATDEGSVQSPSSLYGISKQSQEAIVMNVGTSLGIPCVALRYQNVYGPGQSLQNPYTGILSIFSTRIKNGNHIDIYEDGLESRDFVYIDDVVTATKLALENDAANYQVFNIGSGEAISVNTVAKELCNNLAGEQNYSSSGHFRIGDIRHNYADLRLAESVLGFTPTVHFAEGIERFTQWVDTLDEFDDKYDASVAELKAKGLFK